MANLSKHPSGKWRVRYTIHLPDGTVRDRSRLFERRVDANATLHRAGLLEESIRYGRYNSEDLYKWISMGLISKKDRQALATALPPEAAYSARNLKEIADDFVATWGQISANQRRAKKARLKRILKILGPSTPVASLKPMDGYIVRTRLTEAGLAPRTINRAIQELKAIMNVAVVNGDIPFNPFITLKGIRVRQTFQGKALSQQQVTKVLEKAKASKYLYGWIYLILLFAFGTGLRRSEILALTWSSINWRKRIITVIRTKTGKPRVVGLGNRLYKELSDLREAIKAKGAEPEGTIIPDFYPDSVSKAAKRIFKECGFDLRLHDARHTYATLLQQIAGATPIETMARTGHSNVNMLVTYSHPANNQIFEDKLEFMK